MKKRWVRVLTGVAVVVLAAGGYAFKVVYDAMTPRADYDTQPPAMPALARPALLIFYKTNGHIHEEAIPAATAMIEDIARQRGWSVYATANGAVNNPEDLAKFDAVVWNNVSGDVLTLEQRDAFKHYLEGGGGFVGLHGTGGDPRYAWSWFPETLLKAQFSGHPLHPQFQTATMRIEATQDPIMQGFGDSWVREDEWYSFERSPRAAGVQVLATLDERTYDPEMFFYSIRMGDDHPIIWKHCLKRGRVFYSALGHTAATYQEAQYRTVIERAIAWAAGLEGEGCAADNAPPQ